MRVLDLFSRTGSATEGFREMGWEVVSCEIDEEFEAEYRDIFDLTVEDVVAWDFDAIWASPPCDYFSRLKTAFEGRQFNYASQRPYDDPQPITQGAIDLEMVNIHLI